MIDLHAIMTIARFEVKLLFRSWAFRIFSILGLAILFGMNMPMGTTLGGPQHYLRGLPSALPMMNLKMLNLYQGIIAAFLATEFIKRDRRHDTTQVVYVRSFSNADYILGKILGIMWLFGILNGLVIVQSVIFNAFFSVSPFNPLAYVYYALFISLPTLVFVVGVSFVLVTLLRSQAIVFAIVLAYSLLVLIVIGDRYDFIFDAYAFHQPSTYSDFIGFGGMSDLLRVRGLYFLVGISLMAVSVFNMNRLRQSSLSLGLAGLIAAAGLTGAAVLGNDYLSEKQNDRAYRTELRTINSTITNTANLNVSNYDISVDQALGQLVADCRMTVHNGDDQPLDSLLFSLNPGLTLTGLDMNGSAANYDRLEHLVWIKPPNRMAPGDSARIRFSYEGIPDDLYNYLDIPDGRYEGLYRMWLYTIDKQYGIIGDKFAQLGPESGWYPIPGLSAGAAFPKPAAQNFASFQLKVTVPKGLVAVSQGSMSVDSTGPELVYDFVSDRPLPQISLTIGEYVQRSITVDSVTYSLYHLGNHDYFEPFFDSIADTLDYLIRDMRNDYEIALGLEYPHRRLSVVEVPIQFYSYFRHWTMAQEMVQPEITFMPEMGVIGFGTDLYQAKRGAQSSQRRANQEESPRQLQAGYFAMFVQMDLLQTMNNQRNVRREYPVEPTFDILPNMVGYATRLSSDRWPVLGQAVEAHFRDRVAAPTETSHRYWEGLTEDEKANLALSKASLEEMLAQTDQDDQDDQIVTSAVQAKGRYLMILLESIGGQKNDFRSQISEFLKQHQFSQTTDADFLGFLDEIGVSNAEERIDQWYRSTSLPGYFIDDIECYKVLDGERTRTQIRLVVANPTEVDGCVRVGLRYRTQEANFAPWWTRGGRQSDESRLLYIGAGDKAELGLVAEDQVAEVTIETFVSRNIPSEITSGFRDVALRDKVLPIDSLVFVAIPPDTADSNGTVVVDNEDEGFRPRNATQENWLRRSLMSLIGRDEEEQTYIGMRPWNPPGTWSATTHVSFHGSFIRSAHYKRSGDGQSTVLWAANLEEQGDYDVYYYVEGEEAIPRWGRQRRGRDHNQDLGEKSFIVHHDNGNETVPLDLNGAENGWNLLGTYRLSAGENIVELSDKSSSDIVTADAVKWVKR